MCSTGPTLYIRGLSTIPRVVGFTSDDYIADSLDFTNLLFSKEES